MNAVALNPKYLNQTCKCLAIPSRCSPPPCPEAGFNDHGHVHPRDPSPLQTMTKTCYPDQDSVEPKLWASFGSGTYGQPCHARGNVKGSPRDVRVALPRKGNVKGSPRAERSCAAHRSGGLSGGGWCGTVPDHEAGQARMDIRSPRRLHCMQRLACSKRAEAL